MSRTVFFLVLSVALQLAARPVEAHALLTSPNPRDSAGRVQGSAPDPARDRRAVRHQRSGVAAAQHADRGRTDHGHVERDDQPPRLLRRRFLRGRRQELPDPGREVAHEPADAASPSKAKPRMWSLDVTLPSTPCPKCTLRLRQLMLIDRRDRRQVPACHHSERVDLLQLFERRAHRCVDRCRRHGWRRARAAVAVAAPAAARAEPPASPEARAKAAASRWTCWPDGRDGGRRRHLGRPDRHRGQPLHRNRRQPLHRNRGQPLDRNRGQLLDRRRGQLFDRRRRTDRRRERRRGWRVRDR